MGAVKSMNKKPIDLESVKGLVEFNFKFKCYFRLLEDGVIRLSAKENGLESQSEVFV